MRIVPLLLAAATGAALLAGCGSGGGGDGRPTVVATTTQAADLVRSVAGDRVRVRGVLAPNSDPHDYEVRPGDVKALARATLVVRSGGDLDAWLDGAIDSAGADAPVVDLLDHAGAEGDDPHWWQDPRRAETAVEVIGAALAQADPAGASAYAANTRRSVLRLRALDAAVRTCLAQIPPADRVLVTTHDALGYYARRYGLRVVGTVIPSLSTQAQASAGDLAELVDTIRREHVRAIFAESAVNASVEDAIAQETGARVGRPLWADALGPAGSSGATYEGSIRANTVAIVEGLSGGAKTCSFPR
ncbi:MAG TPA: metal ABC transporter substrate-binding protein [Solirubrobacteraceae bacterium]|nr:metal ABC transporter substrate-binding protein [Solirubrobacteraceae bacterium]